MLAPAKMRRFQILLVVLACVPSLSCSSSDSGGSSSGLDGTWQLTNAAGCPITIAFKGNTFSQNALCLLTSGNYGVEIENGTYSTSNGEIDFLPTQASCPANAVADTDPYSIQGQNLIITFGATQAIFQKITPSTVNGGAVLEDGCWDFSTSPATFTQHPIQTL